MRFYLGTHMPSHIEKTDVPLFISYQRLVNRKRPFKQQGPIAIDSGGFSQLSLHGKWTITAEEYVENLNRFVEELDLKLDWAAQQDWMVEPFMLKKTGLTIKKHQEKTVKNYFEILDNDPLVEIIPVLQGWELEDYYSHFDLFEEQGVELRKLKTVGVGSVCRRQSNDEINNIMQSLANKGINIHGFGVKTNGLKKYSNALCSSDSMAWSFGARYSKSFCSIHRDNSHTPSCNNCLNYALEWREKVLKASKS
jgi:hypothetical protein